MLTFNLKKEWFEKIKSGEKTHEYRLFNNYWGKRLSNARHKWTMGKEKIGIICFKLGYPKNDEFDKILYAKIINIETKMAIFTDLKEYGKQTVYDIKFELV